MTRDCSFNSPAKYKFSISCVQKLFFCFDIQNNICTQHVLNLYFSGDSMNNLLSYFGLTKARIRASEKDLPVCGAEIDAQRFDYKGGLKQTGSKFVV